MNHDLGRAAVAGWQRDAPRFDAASSHRHSAAETAGAAIRSMPGHLACLERRLFDAPQRRSASVVPVHRPSPRSPDTSCIARRYNSISSDSFHLVRLPGPTAAISPPSRPATFVRLRACRLHAQTATRLFHRWDHAERRYGPSTNADGPTRHGVCFPLIESEPAPPSLLPIASDFAMILLCPFPRS